ncbi:sorbitol dehydrogenase (alcohol dehydrogenase GroES-like domain-containing protein) [Colletotrichum truncatum]|uniref:Sorbitol dehydrogenase (Alcohol dehydrogenase GroES-like domain-containing protein) n=1 Tax=Colletotrichum truncatum TaxID=5467 RepID=A0ACC3YTB7_COLTU|nr:sorbitol dehydrogenase (alcohol dehydrogenase GroES-like domain-containing protein) [Colletotrichum truncatum]KAF6785069.1 sorbitol dehydrogenase (alcohol dehydrogenase GroES-like domain-containing protein) [Colletotrichum truncatum]
MATTHLAAVLYGARDLRITPVEAPPLGSDEIQVSPRATGLCGTDQHYYQNGRNGIYQVYEPLILGHEASGEVVAVGSAVQNFQIGDRVVLEPQLACNSCHHCRAGHYNLCKRMRFNGSASSRPPSQGSLQKLWNHPAYLCYNLPESVSFEEGAMVEPLSVALHSVRKAKLEAGQTVLVTGAGAIGLLCARVAKISGASSIIMVDVDETRLSFAQKHGLADQTYKVPTSGLEGESSADFVTRIAAELLKRTRVATATAAFECTGVESCLNLCITTVDAGAKVVLVGMGRPLQNVNLGVALVREIKIYGVWRYTNTFQAAVDLIEAGMVDVKPMITHQYPFEKVAEALELTLSKPPDLVKCIVTSQ